MLNGWYLQQIYLMVSMLSDTDLRCRQLMSSLERFGLFDRLHIAYLLVSSGVD